MITICKKHQVNNPYIVLTSDETKCKFCKQERTIIQKGYQLNTRVRLLGDSEVVAIGKKFEVKHKKN